MVKECDLYKKLKGNKVQCLACSHKCIIGPKDVGICGVRENSMGKLYLLVYGRVASVGIDPIEKKPLNHFIPGSYAYSIGTVGCNFKCGFCQNHEISQASKGSRRFIFGEMVEPEKIVDEAILSGCKSIAYTYNEPFIWVEFVVPPLVEYQQNPGLESE